MQEYRRVLDGGAWSVGGGAEALPLTYKLLLRKVAVSRAHDAHGNASAALDKEVRELFTSYVDESTGAVVLPWQQLVGTLRHVFSGEGLDVGVRRKLMAAALDAIEGPGFPDGDADGWGQRRRWWANGLRASAATASDFGARPVERALASAHVIYAAVRALGEAVWREEAGLHEDDARALARMAAAAINIRSARS